MEKHLLFKRFADKRLHMGVCGSVAAFRAAELVHRWQDTGANVSATLTEAAQKFISPLTFRALGASPVYGDMFGSEEPFEHLEPGQIAHAMVIAPASADMLARLAHGLADDMLTTTFLASNCPKILSPAMNTAMYDNPITQDNLALCKKYGMKVVKESNIKKMLLNSLILLKRIF